MMKHKWIIITLSILFFLAALTFYANRVLLPNFVRKIAIEQAENFLKRSVEIESIRFNWLRGLIINKVKIYQKDSKDEILFQAERISTGIVFIPGFNKHKLILPSINIESPSLHLIHQKDNTWNFTDIVNNATPAKDTKPSPIDVAVGGFKLTNGKMRIDDIQTKALWSELVDELNLQVGLGGSGIAFEGSLSLPKTQGFIGLDGQYQLLTKNLKANIHLKNLRPLDYLNLYPLPLPIKITDGLINRIDAKLEYSAESINIAGNYSIKDVDVAFDQHSFKGNLEALHTDITLKNNTIALKGSYAFNNVHLVSSPYALTGSFTAEFDDFLFNSPEDITTKASLKTDKIYLQLSENQFFQGKLTLLVKEGHLQKDTASLDGQLMIQQALLTLGKEQSFAGNLDIPHIKLNKDHNQTSLQLDTLLNSFDLHLPGKTLKGDLKADQFTFKIDDKNNLSFVGQLSVNHGDVQVDKTSLKGDLKLENLNASYDITNQTAKVKSRGEMTDIIIKTEDNKTFKTHVGFDLNLNYPLKTPSDMQYDGSLSLNKSSLEGLAFGNINDINLKSQFKTNSADISLFSLSFLDTPIIASGHVEGFSKPILDIQAQSERIDLSKISLLAPELLKTYGLTVDGSTSFKIKFQGPALDPLSADINAQASLNNVNISSSTLKQNLTRISGQLKASGHSLSWEDFSFDYMNRTFSLNGHLDDFKNPHVSTNLLTQGIEVESAFNKKDNLITITNLSGHYLSAVFDATGSVDLSSKAPTLDIKNNLRFKLEDIGNFMPDLKKNLDPLKLSGLISVKTNLTGPAANFKEIMAHSNASCDEAQIAGLKFTNLNAEAILEEGKVKKLNLQSNLYEGTLNILSSADLNTPNTPFETAIKMEAVNLAKLKNDTPAKDEDLRGSIAFTSLVNGSLKEPLQIKGSGNLNISEGYLMKKEFVSIFMIAELNNLIFTDASANFTIGDQKINTENFVLKSEGANLNGSGWVGFDHKIQFVLNPEFNTELISQSNSLKKGPSSFIASAAGKYLTIKIDGTLEKPIVKTIKNPTELIKRTGEIITENVGQLLQGIFQ